MRISVIGCGYLGAVHAASMAELGHDVVGIDVDQRKVATLGQARAPFFEPGFEELLERTLATGRLKFSADMADAAGSQVHFVCVGTPQKRGVRRGPPLRAGRGRVPAGCAGARGPGGGQVDRAVGTAARLAVLVEEKVPGALLAWNPEFLREGFAVEDTLNGPAGVRAARGRARRDRPCAAG